MVIPVERIYKAVAAVTTKSYQAHTWHNKLHLACGHTDYQGGNPKNLPKRRKCHYCTNYDPQQKPPLQDVTSVETKVWTRVSYCHRLTLECGHTVSARGEKSKLPKKRICWRCTEMLHKEKGRKTEEGAE